MADKGCSQGAMLSPVLWSRAVDDLLVKLSQREFGVQGYADDIAILISGKFE